MAQFIPVGWCWVRRELKSLLRTLALRCPPHFPGPPSRQPHHVTAGSEMAFPHSPPPCWHLDFPESKPPLHLRSFLPPSAGDSLGKGIYLP